MIDKDASLGEESGPNTRYQVHDHRALEIVEVETKTRFTTTQGTTIVGFETKTRFTTTKWHTMAQAVLVETPPQ